MAINLRERRLSVPGLYIVGMFDRARFVREKKSNSVGMGFEETPEFGKYFTGIKNSREL